MRYFVLVALLVVFMASCKKSSDEANLVEYLVGEWAVDFEVTFQDDNGCSFFLEEMSSANYPSYDDPLCFGDFDGNGNIINPYNNQIMATYTTGDNSLNFNPASNVVTLEGTYFVEIYDDNKMGVVGINAINGINYCQAYRLVRLTCDL